MDEGLIHIIRPRVEYEDINVIEDYDDEYVSTDEVFSSEEGIFPKYSKEAGVNVIVQHFGVPAPIKITYRNIPVVAPVVIYLPGPIPYESYKVVPYKYNATILEDGVEIPIQPLSLFKNITDASRVTRSGHVFAHTFRGDVNSSKKVVENVEPKKVVGESSGAALEKYVNGLLKIIKMSDYNIVD